MGNFALNFFVMTKPRVWAFLLLTGLAGEILALSLARSLNIVGFFYVAIYITAGLMGAESLSNYFDLSIDKKMKRTMNRALPSGRMQPSVALYGGLVLIAITLVMAIFKSFLSFIFMATGIFDYTIVYAMLTKKVTSWNIILGAYSGGAPLLAGFYAFSSSFNLTAFLLFLIIIVWTPLHIWALSIKYREDYKAASVPMLPVRKTTSETMLILFPIALLVTVISVATGFAFRSYFPTYLGDGVLFAYIALGLYIFVSYLRALLDSENKIMKLFAATNIYIGFFFFLFAIFSVLIPFVGVVK